ncbi:hypothetical protein [Dactylosporangium darangshiense]|uniref:Uncharacterized protein n=1 Tax=Dactylosporangium darangshiense TaxID=579108 RepID=A0ABP8DN03_9ACTN
MRVHHGTRGIDFPLYRPGGARAASFGTAREALDAAFQALRIEIVSAGPSLTGHSPAHPNLHRPLPGLLERTRAHRARPHRRARFPTYRKEPT